MKKLLVVFALILASLGMVACGSKTDEELVAEAKEALDISFSVSGDTLNSVTGDLVLASKSTKNDVTITWTSNNTDVISINGKVTRGEEDVVVELTAELKLNEAKDTKVFKVTVKEEGSEPVGGVDSELPAKFNDLAKDKKVYLTSLGQAGDLSTLNTLLSRFVYNSAEASEYNEKVKMVNILTAGEVEDGSIVVLVPGASTKGLGAAGTNLAAEKARAEAFAAKAKDGKITVIVAHIGGEARRGNDTDPLITAAVDGAALVLAVESGNFDGFFDGISNDDVYYFSQAAKLSEPFKQIFNK